MTYSPKTIAQLDRLSRVVNNDEEMAAAISIAADIADFGGVSMWTLVTLAHLEHENLSRHGRVNAQRDRVSRAS